MKKEINLKVGGGYHFGIMVDLKKYSGSYFECNNEDVFGYIYKAIIFCITYNPDYIYIMTNGHFGNCWTARIHDARFVGDDYEYNLNFRNFSDLIGYYESQDMKYCPEIIYNKTT